MNKIFFSIKKFAKLCKKKFYDYSNNKMNEIESAHYIYKPATEKTLVKEKYTLEDYKFLSYEQLCEISKQKLRTIKILSKILFATGGVIFILLGICGWAVFFGINMSDYNYNKLAFICAFSASISCIILSVIANFQFRYINLVSYAMSAIVVFLSFFSNLLYISIIALLLIVSGTIGAHTSEDILELRKIKGFPYFRTPNKYDKDYEKELERVAKKRNL